MLFKYNKHFDLTFGNVISELNIFGVNMARILTSTEIGGCTELLNLSVTLFL